MTWHAQTDYRVSQGNTPTKVAITHTGDKYTPDFGVKNDCPLEYSCVNCPTTGDLTASFAN